MALIDLVKLNAEVDKLINNQKKEIEVMNAEMRKSYEILYAEMATDLTELLRVATNVLNNGKSYIHVRTDIKSRYGYPTEDYTIRFSKTDAHHVYIMSFDTGIDYMDVRDSYGYNRRKLGTGNFTADLDKILREWSGQKDAFIQRFEEECVKAIKEKARTANENYAYAERLRDEANVACQRG